MQLPAFRRARLTYQGRGGMMPAGLCERGWGFPIGSPTGSHGMEMATASAVGSTGGMKGSSTTPARPRLSDRMLAAIRSRHASRRTERTYCHPVKQFAYSHYPPLADHPGKTAEPEINAILTLSSPLKKSALPRHVRMKKELFKNRSGPAGSPSAPSVAPLGLPAQSVLESFGFIPRGLPRRYGKMMEWAKVGTFIRVITYRCFCTTLCFRQNTDVPW